MIPAAEAVLTTYLQAAVDSLGAEVVDQTPNDTSNPWVRLTLLDAPSDGITDHLIANYVQLDVYAGDSGEDSHEDASLIARTVRAALVTIHQATHDGAVFTGPARIDGYTRSPDDSVDEPARERYIVTATVWAHD
jgi:hypothetical protein